MSGLLGNSGPGVLGKLLARNEKKYGNVEKPGFSGTMKQNKKGKWYSVQGRADKRRRRNRTRLVTSVVTGNPGKGYVMGELGG